MSEANLFQREAYASLGDLEVEVKERVVRDKFIILNEVKFDFDDLRETLYEVDAGGVTTCFTRDQTRVLKELGILESEGNSRWGSPAFLGPNGNDFIEKLEELYDLYSS